MPARQRRGADSAAESGAAVVEFVLVATLLIALFLGVIQVGIALHVRNTLTASAAEGARYAANADRTPEDGVVHARALIAQALAPRFAEEVSAGYASVDGVTTVVVEVRATLPVIGFLGPSRSMVVRARALEEAP